jgi:hypothetical protein
MHHDWLLCLGFLALAAIELLRLAYRKLWGHRIELPLHPGLQDEDVRSCRFDGEA